MAGKTALSDGEDEIQVEQHEMKESDGDAVDSKEDEGVNKYAKDGLIVDDADGDEHDAEEEDRADSDDERQKKKKRIKREEDGDIGEETEKDEYIRKIDIPERMQISEEITGPPPTDEMSIEEESTWILYHLEMDMSPFFGILGTRTNEEGYDLAIVKDDIKRFLELTHIQKLDVPFIAMYRKEECSSLFKDPGFQGDEDDQKPTLRWHKVLWAILELDRKWLLLRKRKRALQSYYTEKFVEEGTEKLKLFDSITNSLKAAESEREIDDVDWKFNLHFPPGDVGVDEGLKEVASKFGCCFEDFGLFFSLEQMRKEELEDAKETPEEVASRFTCAMFENPQAVLRGARHMAAVEISYEPCVRKHVRRIRNS